jgi:hypothetical protein
LNAAQTSWLIDALHVERHGGAGRAGEIKKMNAIHEQTEPTLWKAGQSENARLKGELVACEKERKSLNDLVRHIGETVIRHVRGKG